MAFTPQEMLVTEARSRCWETYGLHAEQFTNLQCVIRTVAIHLEDGGIQEAEKFLDLAEEMAGEEDGDNEGDIQDW